MAAAAEALTRESDAMEAQLAPLRAAAGASSAPPVMSAEERIREEAYSVACFDAWASRRRAFRELWGTLAEQMDVKDKALQVLIPFEKDEGHGANFETAKATAAVVAKALSKRRRDAKTAEQGRAAGRA